jgi:glycerol-3-phosphate acyltransferase PlsY
MEVNMALAISAILAAYLLGSIPSAYLIGRFWGKINLLKEGDGHISATAIYREMGRIAFVVTIIMDAGKGALAIFVAMLLSGSVPVIVAAAYAVVIGHCWSVFIRFRGGLGAAVTYGALAAVAFWQFLIAGAIALIITFTLRRTSLATYVLIATVSIILLIQGKDLLLALFPLGLILVPLLKRFQVSKTNPVSSYKNDLFDDLKRQK